MERKYRLLREICRIVTSTQKINQRTGNKQNTSSSTPQWSKTTKIKKIKFHLRSSNINEPEHTSHSVSVVLSPEITNLAIALKVEGKVQQTLLNFKQNRQHFQQKYSSQSVKRCLINICLCLDISIEITSSDHYEFHLLMKGLGWWGSLQFFWCFDYLLLFLLWIFTILVVKFRLRVFPPLLVS